MTTTRIRPAERADISLIAGFQVLLARETEDFALDPGIVGKGVAAVFDDPKKGLYYVAENQGRVVGAMLTVSEWSDWRNGTVLWIHSVYVVPEQRRHGVFGALYAHVKALVENNVALKGLRLYVEKTNTRAQTVYDRLGMTSEHYTMFEWLK